MGTGYHLTSAWYEVLTDKMSRERKFGIECGNELVAHEVGLDQIVGGKTYIVSDAEGNVFLGRIRSFSKNDLEMILYFSNPVYLKRTIPMRAIRLQGEVAKLVATPAGVF
jgi:ribosomal protein S27AE